MVMSALARYTRPADGTIPIPALLYDDESLIASQDGVGLYDGPNKSAAHQSGTVHITSHRLFFIAGAPSASPLHAPLPAAERGASIALDLEAVAHTESYAGFFTSSPKVTLHLRAPERDADSTTDTSLALPTPKPATSGAWRDVKSSSPAALAGPSTSHLESPAPTLSGLSDNPFDLWECEICGYRNPPGLSPAARSACGLCGMPRSVSSSATPSSSTPLPLSTAPPNVPAPRPVLVRTASARSATLSAGTAHLYSRSLPSSSANTPAPLSMPPASRANANLLRRTLEEGHEGAEVRRRRKRRPSALACPACTFLNHPYLRECEICGTALLPAAAEPEVEVEHEVSQKTGLQPPHFTSKSAPTSRPSSPTFDENSNNLFSTTDIAERERYIKLSFRRGGDKAFYAALKTALQQKEWEVRDAKWKMNGPGQETSAGHGISGILQSIDSTAQHTERGMSDAFADLEALMSKAQDMVRLAKGLNEQLTASARNPAGDAEPLEPEEATFVRSSLGQLGLGMRNTAVTADMSGDEQQYLEQLAIELTAVLEGSANADLRADGSGDKMGIMRKRGIVGLDEVWGGWNRARGVALISPETTLKALPYLPLHTTPPITTRTLASGLRVLHTPAYALPAFAARLVALLVDVSPRTTAEVAGTEALSVGLVDELMHEVEERGDICRDDPGAGISGGAGVGVEVSWWANAFNGYVWDGQDE